MPLTTSSPLYLILGCEVGQNGQLGYYRLNPSLALKPQLRQGVVKPYGIQTLRDQSYAVCVGPYRQSKQHRSKSTAAAQPAPNREYQQGFLVRAGFAPEGLHFLSCKSSGVSPPEGLHFLRCKPCGVNPPEGLHLNTFSDPYGTYFS